MKSPITKLVFILLISSTLIGTNHAHEEHGIEGEASIVYDIIESNNATNTWYDSVSNISRLYHVENGTQMNITISNVEDPQSDISFAIGSLTIVNVPDADAEEVFSFGYYQIPATFGFVANTSWTATKFEMDKIDFYDLNFTFPHLQYLGGEVDTTLIEFKDTFQTSRLIYDETTGILLEAHSVVLGFQLSILINSINGDPNFHQVSTTSNSTDETPIFSPIILLLTIFFFSLYDRTKR
ncbi:MAG: hypothetical protein ACW99A_09905 [Candidatus Kariarchaeaceae archaeon]